MTTPSGPTGAAAVVVLAVALSGVLSGCGGGAAGAPTATVAAAAASAPSGGSLQDPQVGVAYPYELLTHCGIRAATFGGRTWVAVTPQEPPDAATNFTSGTMTLLAPDRARFSWPGGTADFVPATGPLPLCQ